MLVTKGKTTQIGKIMCSQCGAKYKNLTFFNEHFEKNHLRLAFSCTECPETAPTRKSLQSHKLQKHKASKAPTSFMTSDSGFIAF